MSRFQVELASQKDDPGLRQILRETPMEGAISLSFEREPNYFIGAIVEGPEHQIIVGRDTENGELIGMGGRSMRPIYLNGQAQTIGYLSQFRVRPAYRGLFKILVEAWAELQELHKDQKSPFYYTSIIKDNYLARRLLTRQLPGFPKYSQYTRMHTLAIYSRRLKKEIEAPAGITITRAKMVHIEQIIACLQRNLARFQLAPYWSEETLFIEKYTPNLTPEDFFIALKNDHVVGCLALWDQTGFKQTVVRGYARGIGRWRWLLNPFAKLLGYPRLPDVDQEIKYAYASHLAVDDDNPEIYQALLRTLYRRAVNEGYSYFMIGLNEDHPLRALTQNRYRHIDYTSILYWVNWDDDLPVIDDRIAAPEIAIL